MREYLEFLLARAGYVVTLAATEREAVQRLSESAVDLVVSDIRIGAGSGMGVLRAARALAAPPEVILITAFGTPASAVEAMRAGAYDYICKPFDNEELLLLVQKALEKRGLREENQQLRKSLDSASLWVGRSPAMRAVAALVEKVAASRSTILITGESGTGKELVARGIHMRSPRASATFLPINCAALNEGVLESELFGHVRGAFTGAAADRTGLLVAAGEGTVFLDEIAEVPAATQVKLLRVLQERKVKPVGGTVEIPFAARLVAATNKSLEAEVKAGRFREDLLYRLNVINLELPPLRERGDDIRLLTEHFLSKMREELGRPHLRFSEEALEALERYRFPGNVRQLQNVVERAATLAETEVLGLTTLPLAVRGERELPAEASSVTLSPKFSLEHFLDENERRYLLEALRQAGGVKTRAAELLGLSFRSLRYRLAKHGLTDESL
ncbi:MULTISPECIES: sigma-54 dependent transcriptional regulator [Myxococcaceae]|uniref:sigma-54-dependent transcriptional regulator n=1 Tax=Myxococcaceae TaxID=31 RepID=UPI00129CC207|nr:MULTISPECIES: sigma-54 dependent transcriptional regulator [Myxococcaceae]